MKWAVLVGIIALFSVTGASAQCEFPKNQFEQAPNMFTPDQEGFLGEVEAQQLEQHLHLITDSELNAYPNQIAQRLLKNAPSSPYNYRLQLIDEPYVNAFGIAGGRIYLTRKIVLLAKDEDQLAGLIAHELSHIYTRQIGADYTRIFHDVLGVNQVSDRADVVHRYHQLLDTWHKRRFSVESGRGEKEQFVADQTAIYLMARSGYNTSAFGDFFEVIGETKGKTGGFWSDLFGTTPPEAKRLRSIIETASSLPASCREPAPAGNQNLKDWQKKLLEWSGPVRKNVVRDVVIQTKLVPPLLSDINRLKFSADGKYILAQDDAVVSVLTREPFAHLFQVELPSHPLAASFSPDSRYLVVASSSGRVEKWNLINFKRESVYELPTVKSCLQSQLSPDGNTVACFASDYSLQLLEVATGSVIFERKKFYVPSEYAMFLIAIVAEFSHGFHYVEMDFSPDGRYFAVAAPYNAVAVEIPTRTATDVRGPIKDIMKGGFSFAGADRIVARKGPYSNDAMVVEFPSGKTLYKFEVGIGQPRAVTKGDKIIVDPIREGYTGVYDLAAGKFIGAIKSDAFDMYDHQFVAEMKNGVLGLAEPDDKNWSRNEHRVQLPLPQLGNLRVVSISDDLQRLALSETSRGGVFDLSAGARVSLLRSFRGAWFTPDKLLWADFPEYEKVERKVLKVDVDHGKMMSERVIEKSLAGHQYGPYFLVHKPAKKDNFDDQTLEIHDVSDDKLLWSTRVKGNPDIETRWIARTITVRWPASSPAAKEAAHGDPALANRLNAIRDRDKSYYLEVLNLENGQTLGHLAIDSGKRSFSIESEQATPDYVACADDQQRVRLYSLATGEELGVMFAESYDLSRAGMLAVSTNEHRLQIYDARTMESVDEYEFESPVAVARFIGDGSRLLVLTRDQTAFIFKPQSHTAETVAAK